MSGNKSFHAASIAKEDEFYTQLSDIENELKHYKTHFENKVVFCNCDDPFESNFFKYFALNFNTLKLKKLICTGYDTSPVMGKQLSLFDDIDDNFIEKRYAYKIEITNVGDMNKDGSFDINDILYLLKQKKNVLKLLKGNGDFRSDECIELLKDSDIVVTNPPFSLFREYMAELIKYEKNFLVIGNQNNVSTKDFFPLIKDNKVWMGYKCGDMSFMVPDYYQPRETRFWIDENGQKWRSLGNICWYTNLDIPKRHENLLLYKKYSKEEYQEYDNYKAINVDKVSDIPEDYFGVMGVPVTFLDKYNPEQFKIIGHTHSADKTEDVEKLRTSKTDRHRGLINGKQKYERILIQRVKKGDN